MLNRGYVALPGFAGLSRKRERIRLDTYKKAA